MKLESEVEKETRERQLWSIKCRVAYDLESNWYWKAIGYTPVENTISTWLNQKESKSKRPIIVYEKMLNFDGCGLEPFFKEAQDLEL